MGGDSIVHNGSVLAVRDFFKQGGGTQYYLAGSPASAGLVTFIVDKDAIQFEGAAIGNQGVIYAAKGGIKLTGSAALQGAAIGGGNVPEGQVKFGGGTTMTYPAGLLPSASWLPDIAGGPSDCGLPAGLPPFLFPDSAITSNGDVSLSGGASTFSDPASYHGAHIYTNGSFSGSGNVDGGAYAVGSSSGGTAYDGFHPGSPPVEFPDPYDIDRWEASIIADAQAGPTVGSQSFGSDATITGPLYINGDLTMSGGNTLRVEGNSTVYVTGGITASGGSIVYNSGVLASGGEANVSGGGAYYVIGDPIDVLLVSFAQSNKALELSGGSTGDAQGVVYAPNGGVVLSGSSSFIGALVAGGQGTNGKVVLSGGSSVLTSPGLVGSNNHIPGGGAEGGGASSGTGLVLQSKTEL
jgi:hypothetical protein